MAGDNSYDWVLYRYNPSLAAAVIFVVLFLLTTFVHAYQLARTRIWYMIPFLIGGFFEWIGYIGRAASSQQSPNWTLGPYITQTLLLLVAPALFAASIYMELSRIVLLADGESHVLIKKKWLTKIFVAGDVLSFSTQAAGGGIMAGGTLDSLHTGTKLIIVGLFMQIIFFGIFIIVAMSFDIAMQKRHMRQQSPPRNPWRKHLIVLYVASGLIMVRSIFRAVEYIQGNDGYILQHEYFLYVFDALLMWVVMVIFNVFHPSEVNALLRGGNIAKGLRVYALQSLSTQQPAGAKISA